MWKQILQNDFDRWVMNKEQGRMFSEKFNKKFERERCVFAVLDLTMLLVSDDGEKEEIFKRYTTTNTFLEHTGRLIEITAAASLDCSRCKKSCWKRSYFLFRLILLFLDVMRAVFGSLALPLPSLGVWLSRPSAGLSKTRILYAWHGLNTRNIDSVCRFGLQNFRETDDGWFGCGHYVTRCASAPALLYR